MKVPLLRGVARSTLRKTDSHNSWTSAASPVLPFPPSPAMQSTTTPTDSASTATAPAQSRGLWKMCCLAGANDNDNKHASSPEVRNFLTWRASQQSCQVFPPPPYPPLHSTTGTPHSQSWRIFPYNSFICPSIHFENVNSCASSLFDYSCFISCIYVFSPFPTFPSLSPVWGWLFASDFSLWQRDSFSFSCFAFVFWKIAW